MLYLIAHSPPRSNEPLPADIVIATLTKEAAWLGHLDARNQLKRLADAMGLWHYTISNGDPLETKGIQLPLPFATKLRKVRK